MAEVLTIAPGVIEGLTPRLDALPLCEIPPHLLRRELIKKRENHEIIPDKDWTDRGEQIEKRVMTIVESQTHIVKQIIPNPPYAEKNDFRAILVDGSEVKVEVKSSMLGIKAYKQKIRKELINKALVEKQLNGYSIETKKDAADVWNMLTDDEKYTQYAGWLTENNTILINGGEEDKVEKTPKEILTDSFYPQLQRIMMAKRKAAVNGFAESLGKYRDSLAEKGEIRQLFPPPDEQLTLPLSA